MIPKSIIVASRCVYIMVAMMLLFVTTSYAQYLTLSVDRNSILLGEHFQLELKLTVPVGTGVGKWPAVPDSVNHLEVIDRGSVDSVRQGDKMLYTQKVTMTGFDSGHWVIPPLSAMVNNKEIASASTAIDVQNIKLSGNDYNDIKEIIEVDPPGPDWKRILLYALGIALIAALVYYWMKGRRKEPAAAKPVSRGTAYDEALKALNALGQEQLLAKGETKRYYTRLYDIYRTYLGAITGTNIQQRTTDDLLLVMKPMMNNQIFSGIAEVMRISDAVKFAKYMPPQEEGGKCMDITRTVIDELNRQKQ
jgi:hypothetical protein